MICKLKKQKIFLIILAISMIFMISGCNLVKNATSLKEKFNDEPPSVSIEVPQENQFQEVPISSDYAIEDPSGETVIVQLWFSDGQGQKLVVESREINKVEGLARATINELIKGPSADSDLLPVMPVGTVLKDINVKEDGLIIVDFSKELVDNHLGGSTSESLTVHSIVNTLTQFPTVDKVQFLIEGQYVETLTGHVDISEAITSSADFAP